MAVIKVIEQPTELTKHTLYEELAEPPYNGADKLCYSSDPITNNTVNTTYLYYSIAGNGVYMLYKIKPYYNSIIIDRSGTTPNNPCNYDLDKVYLATSSQNNDQASNNQIPADYFKWQAELSAIACVGILVLLCWLVLFRPLLRGRGL